MSNDVPAATRSLVIARAQGRCELRLEGVCRGKYENLAHRLPRRYQNHRPSNLLALCGSGTLGCHGWITEHPSAAYPRGWALRDGANPATTPVLLRPANWWPAWWLLGDDATYTWVMDTDETDQPAGQAVSWPPTGGTR